MFFDIPVRVRFSKKQLEEIEEIIERDSGESWDNISHFIRCATIRSIRKYLWSTQGGEEMNIFEALTINIGYNIIKQLFLSLGFEENDFEHYQEIFDALEGERLEQLSEEKEWAILI